VTDAQLIAGLLERERRLVALYDAGLERRLLEAATARLLRDQERAHARGLEQALAGMGARVPDDVVTAPDITRPQDFLAAALRAEDEAVAAYVDALAVLRNPRLVQPLASIAASEGQHQVILRLMDGRSGVA
jgi:ferritin-like protein